MEDQREVGRSKISTTIWKTCEFNSIAPYIANERSSFLKEIFNKDLSETVGYLYWPPRSSYLILFDYFLQNYLKTQVWKNSIQCIPKRKDESFHIIYKIEP